MFAACRKRLWRHVKVLLCSQCQNIAWYNVHCVFLDPTLLGWSQGLNRIEAGIELAHFLFLLARKISLTIFKLKNLLFQVPKLSLLRF